MDLDTICQNLLLRVVLKEPHPNDFWEERIIKEKATPAQIQKWADELKIHPALIAGRIRHHSGDYRRLSRFVGTGTVRRQFQET